IRIKPFLSCVVAECRIARVEFALLRDLHHHDPLVLVNGIRTPAGWLDFPELLLADLFVPILPANLLALLPKTGRQKRSEPSICRVSSMGSELLNWLDRRVHISSINSRIGFSLLDTIAGHQPSTKGEM